MKLPNLSDIHRKQYENQFTRPPDDPIFKDPKKAIFITAIQTPSAQPWTLTYRTYDETDDTCTGTGSQEFHHPLAIAAFEKQTGIARIRGFYLIRNVV